MENIAWVFIELIRRVFLERFSNVLFTNGVGYHGDVNSKLIYKSIKKPLKTQNSWNQVGKNENVFIKEKQLQQGK